MVSARFSIGLAELRESPRVNRNRKSVSLLSQIGLALGELLNFRDARASLDGITVIVQRVRGALTLIFCDSGSPVARAPSGGRCRQIHVVRQAKIRYFGVLF
jgi:hypothetical protein